MKAGETYYYTNDLLSLEHRNPIPTLVDPQVSTIHTPLSWHRHLQSHPDKNFSDYILKNISSGF